jgi:hypothetical protein
MTLWLAVQIGAVVGLAVAMACAAVFVYGDDTTATVQVFYDDLLPWLLHAAAMPELLPFLGHPFELPSSLHWDKYAWWLAIYKSAAINIATYAFLAAMIWIAMFVWRRTIRRR